MLSLGLELEGDKPVTRSMAASSCQQWAAGVAFLIHQPEPLFSHL